MNVKYDDQWRVSTSEPEYIVALRSRERICAIDIPGAPDTFKENVKLICRAPDMYRALKKLNTAITTKEESDAFFEASALIEELDY